MSNTVGSFSPCGYRVIVEPESGEKTTQGGIILPSRERIEQEMGKIVAIGPLAWMDHGNGQPWAEVGDRVIYAKYGGRMISDPATGKEYKLLNDEDISCIVHTDEYISNESYFPE